MTTSTKFRKRYAWFFVLAALALGGNAALAAGPKGENLVDVAVAVNSDGAFAGAFDTLIAAVLAADSAVVQTLTGNGQHTVFAPTDTAFEMLGITAENLRDLLDDGTLTVDGLTQILLYHVAHGRRTSGDVLASEKIRMLNGGFVQQAGGVLTDNQGGMSNIIVTDVPAANGVIHAINAVLLP
ncbi:MAG: fasciclin domain-containing protein [Gammaproteobacteria bacterium]|jgi:uncharacterized surface protein with fasciclin (FAS1) repeats